MNDMLRDTVLNNTFSLLQCRRQQAICRRMNAAANEARCIATVGLLIVVFTLQVDVAEDYVAAGKCVAAREFHRGSRCRSPGYVLVEDFTHFHRWSLDTYQELWDTFLDIDSCLCRLCVCVCLLQRLYDGPNMRNLWLHTLTTLPNRSICICN